MEWIFLIIVPLIGAILVKGLFKAIVNGFFSIARFIIPLTIILLGLWLLTNLHFGKVNAENNANPKQERLDWDPPPLAEKTKEVTIGL